MLSDKKLFSLLFLGLEEEGEQSEAIITVVSETEQILEVSAGAGARPYIIVGKRTGEDGVFVGKHHGPKEDPKVFARWIANEDVIMGVWVEDEQMFAFSGAKDSDFGV